MNFLKPISSNKIPWSDPTVKVESRFLDLYADKEKVCLFWKFSTKEQILIKQIGKLWPFFFADFKQECKHISAARYALLARISK
jgi:hypothetical protein